MPKDIFKAVDASFVESYFSNKKDSFFPDLSDKNIEKIEIKRVSPDWAKDTCLVRYKLLFESGITKTIRGTAKIDTSKEGVWNIMSHLYKNIDDSINMAIPRPLEYLKEINLLLYEEAPGTPLVSILQEDDNAAKKDALKEAAAWLSWLHNISSEKTNIPEALFIGLAGYKKTLMNIEVEIPDLKNYLPDKRDMKFIDDAWTSGNTIIHNDFYPGNSIIGDEMFFGIDFDRSGLGPPLMDVAALFSFFDFSERMWPHKMNEEISWDLKETFLREYCKNNRLDFNKTIEDMYPFLIKSFLDQLHYYVGFFIRGRDFMDKPTRDAFSMIIKDILDEIKNMIKR